MDIAPVNKIIKSLEDETVTGGQLESTIKKVQGFLTPKGGKEFLSFKQLQRSKKEIDGLVNKIGPDAIDPSVKGELIKIKTSLVEQMKKASPPFKEASERFAKESKAVNELQESLIGRVADVTDKQLKTISSEIFNPRTSVDDVLKARKTIEKIDPSAWDGIVRNELDFRVSSITKSIEEGGINTIPNIPALLKRSIFGTGNKREVMLRSLTPEQRKNFIFLETTLSRAGQGRAAGSPTASNLEILKDLRPKLGLLKDIFLTPIKKLQETGETGLFNKAVKGLAGVMLDTKWQPRLAKLRKLDNRSPAAARAMVQLVDDAIAADTADNTPSAKE